MKALRILAAVSALTLLAGWIFREPLLNACFDVLEKSEQPTHADVAVVFGGDSRGHRVLTAAQLARDGFVSAVIVDGPGGAYGRNECDLAIPFAVEHGYPESYFRHFHGDFTNTADEAAAVIAELRRQGVKKVLLVTSGYHTRRTSGYFNAVHDIEHHVIASPDEYANHGTWWKHREGRKTIFMEWTKTIATWLGI